MMGKPKIRFKGYNEDWEQRKFSDVGSVAMCKRIFKEQTSDEGEVPFYKIGTFGGIPDAFISRKLFDEYKTKYPYPNKGDILISASGSIGRTVEFTGKDEYFQDSNIVWLKHGDEIDNSFLKVLYSVVEWSCEGSTIKRLYNDNFLKTNFMLPKIDEQIKLGAYFSSLDHLITLHQHKCDEMKKLKKYMLQKMFPQNGKKVPEIRFDGFTNDWEQRKLGEIADKAVDNRGKTPFISKEGTHPLLEVASLGSGAPDYSKVTKYLSDETFKTELRAYIKEGDILFSTVGSIGLVSLMDTNENAAIAQNIVAFRANESYDSKFLYAMLSTEENQYKAQRIVMGAVQPSIKVSQLVDVEYFVTENIAEQRKLGEYFLNLDHLITLHQHKCDELQNLKKYMLQNMFV